MQEATDGTARAPTFRVIRAIARSAEQTIDTDDTWEELAARVLLVPAGATVRGMFLGQIKDLAPSGSAPERRYIPFKMYPVREYMELLLTTSRAKYPRLTPSNALLRLGRGVYPLFASTVSGAAIFAFAGHSFRRICELSPQAYRVTLSPGSSTTGLITDNEATVQLRNVWPFVDIFHAGIWLGAMKVCNVMGTIDVTRHSECNSDFHMKWHD